MQPTADPERWRAIREILHSALELPFEQREAFVERASAGDPAMRSEILSLIEAAEGTLLIDHPAIGHPAIGQQPTMTIERSIRMSLKPGDLISHYRVIEKIGEGGMGEVYKATDTVLGRTVALKVMSEPDKSERHRQRFIHEAKAASALNHPNIITIYEFNQHGDMDFIAMEYVDGATLNELRDQPLEKRIGYAAQAARAIAKAHEAGIVHRDLKPGNIMVTRGGVVKVLDFGLAKQSDSDDGAGLTRTGVVVGTPAYMSPEQAMGETIGPAADIFCFGIILYELACGRRPFEGKTALATIDQLTHKQPRPPAELNPRIPAGLGKLVEACLKKSPADRPQSMDEIAAALESILMAKPASSNLSRRQVISVSVAAVLFVTAGIGVYEISHAASKLPSALTYTLEEQRTGEEKPHIASPSDTFEAGWKFRLHARPPGSGFLYVVNRGPGPDGSMRYWVLNSEPVDGSSEVVTDWYAFDQNPGTEFLWIVWSQQAIGVLENTGKIENAAIADKIRDILSELQTHSGRTNGDSQAISLMLRHR